VEKFPKVLKFLEDERDNKSELGVISFGISMITLEDIFLKIIKDRLEQDHILHSDYGHKEGENEGKDDSEYLLHALKPSTLSSQLFALVKKNVRISFPL